jgi:hypothetical protein
VESFMGSMLVAGLLALGTMAAAAARPQRVEAPLVGVGGSHVTGVVTVTRTPLGTRVQVEARGLDVGEQYVVLYHGARGCDLQPDDIRTRRVGLPLVDQAAIGSAAGFVGDDPEGVQSVSVRIGPPELQLEACADLHR